MPDYIVLEKEAVEKLSFLNGEVGKTKEVLASLEKDVQKLELNKQEQEKEFLSDSNAFASRVERQNKEIEFNDKKLDELRSEISKIDKQLEDKQGEMLDANAKLEKSILANGEVIKSQQAREANIASKTKDLEKREKDIYLKEGELESRTKVVNEKDKNLVEEYSKIEASKTELESLKKEEKDKILLADRIINTHSNKENELKAIETQVQKNKTDVAEQKVALEKYRSTVEDFAKTVASRENTVSGKESDINKKEKAVIDREAAVLLREAECRVREKALNIATREKQLDGQV